MQTALVTSTLQLLPWLIFIDSIKVQISNECDNHSGPLARNPQDFIIILGGDDISRSRPSSQMKILQDGTNKEVPDPECVAVVAPHELRARLFQGKQHEEGVTVANQTVGRGGTPGSNLI